MIFTSHHVTSRPSCSLSFCPVPLLAQHCVHIVQCCQVYSARSKLLCLLVFPGFVSCRASYICYAPISSYTSTHVTPPLCYHNTGRTRSLSLPHPTWHAPGARTHTPHTVLWVCQLHTTPPQWEEVAKVKSVVEKAVDTIREKKKGKVPSPVSTVALVPADYCIVDVAMVTATLRLS